MPKSKVFFTDLKTTPNKNLFYKLDMLLKRAGIENIIEEKDLVAVKLHFGEKGNLSYVRPVFVRRIVDKIKSLRGKPFLTDTNTLYVGSRSDSVSHIATAIENGFSFSVVNAPIIISDGLKGRSFSTVKIDKKWYKDIDIASDIYQSDALVCVTHFKCHELSGIGGAIKNIGMGCAPVKGKLNQHSGVNPFINKSCNGCKKCEQWCKYSAIIHDGKKNSISNDKCVGCGECIITCPIGAIKIKWNASTSSIQEKMAEHTYGAIANKRDKIIFISFIMQVSPACDCYPSNDVPIVNNIGIAASKDPIAIDQASADLVNKMEGNNNSKLSTNLAPGEDKFRGIYPDIDWTVHLSYGEEIGLGTRNYELINCG